MKILYINEFLNSPSGACIHGRQIISELKKLGLHVITIPTTYSNTSIRYKTRFKQDINKTLPPVVNEYIIFVKKIWRSILLLFHIFKIIKQERPQILLIRPGVYDLLPIWLPKLVNLPMILEVNAPLYLERENAYKLRGKKFNTKLFFKDIEVNSWKNARALYVISDILKDLIYNELKIKAPIIKVIPNGVDLGLFMSNKEEHFESQEVSVKICFVGNINKRYGIENLLHVCGALMQKEIAIRLYFIGEGDCRNYLQKVVERDNILRKNVVFTGYLAHEETIRRMKRMDILVAPYLQQDLFYFSPIKIFEYMAAGRAIVASNIGPIGRILENNVDSLLIAPGNKEELRRALLKLIHDKKLRVRLGNNVFKKAKQYTWKKSAGALLTLIKEITS